MTKRNRELELAGLFDKNSDYEGMLGNAVQELLDVFKKQGHSGFSAQRTAYLFYTLIKKGILTPITGEDSEWSESIDKNDTIKQNKRLSSVFKKEDGKAYYLDAIVWQGEDSYDTFTGQVEDVQSRQYVKFPFYPKTFTIDVVKEKYDQMKHGDSDYVECGSGKYIYKIKDREQLLPVFEYYNEYKAKPLN